MHSRQLKIAVIFLIKRIDKKNACCNLGTIQFVGGSRSVVEAGIAVGIKESGVLHTCQFCKGWGLCKTIKSKHY